MREDEIKIGVVYKCRGGWYRRPTDITSRDGDVPQVAYDFGRTVEANQNSSTGPFPWFARHAYTAVGQSGPEKS